MKNENVKQALLTDDVPNAKQKVIALIVTEVLMTVSLGVLLFFASKFNWGVIISVAIFLCWVVAEILWWQLWKSIAYRLTVTDQAIVVRLFCRKKTLPFTEVISYGYKLLPDSKFFRFTLWCKNGSSFIADTQYRDEMMAILQTHVATDIEGVNRGPVQD